MLWGLADYYVDQVIAVYPTREQAMRALKVMLTNEPDWEGMLDVVPVPDRRRCLPKCRRVRAPRCVRRR